MGVYSGFGSAASGTDKTIITLIGGTGVRAKLNRLIISSPSTPADVAIKLLIARFTAVGTEGAGFTPNAHGDDPKAATADYGVGVFTVEPTYTANKELLVVSLNQRAVFQWVANPGYEFSTAVASGNGIGLKSSAVSTGTPTIDATIFHEE